MKWEVNTQRNEKRSWVTTEHDTKEEAKKSAEQAADWGWRNVNWSAVTSSNEKSVAWVVRNGVRK